MVIQIPRLSRVGILNLVGRSQGTNECWHQGQKERNSHPHAVHSLRIDECFSTRSSNEYIGRTALIKPGRGEKKQRPSRMNQVANATVLTKVCIQVRDARAHKGRALGLVGKTISTYGFLIKDGSTGRKEIPEQDARTRDLAAQRTRVW